MSSYKKYFKYFQIFIIFIITCLILVYYIRKQKERFDDMFTCTMTLDNINPMFKNTYMLFDNKHISCGVCKNAKLNMVVNSCEVDEDGSPIASCISKGQKGTIASSLGNPITFTSDVSPDNISNFFCITL